MSQAPSASASSVAPVATGSSLTELTLHVRQEHQPEQEVFLQHGLSIGRNPSNTICIDHPDVERIHAQVMKQPDGKMLLECIDEQLHVTLSDGSKVHAVELHPGATFKLGAATVRCLKRETKPTVVVADNPWQVRCPRCHEVIATLPHDAPGCPACRVGLLFHEPPVDPATGQAIDSFEGWLPKQVGPYRVRAFVAQGGMGIVLRGLHEQSDSLAAIKLLKMDPDDDPSWRARFVAEIDTLQALKHPNVVRLQAHGQDDKLLWLAMDWIDGTPLSKWAGRIRNTGQQVPIDQIRQVMNQVVHGLIYLHQKSIIHRDLKPSNILLAQDDSVKMVDFGIARPAGGQSGVVTQLTQTGMVAGTESYMSPEQAEGKTLTTASDIYSLAIIWYELITGRRPVGAFMAPHLARPDCPPTWSSTIGACLSAEPRMRPTLESMLMSLSGAVPPPMPTMRPPIGPPMGRGHMPPPARPGFAPPYGGPQHSMIRPAVVPPHAGPPPMTTPAMRPPHTAPAVPMTPPHGVPLPTPVAPVTPTIAPNIPPIGPQLAPTPIPSAPNQFTQRAGNVAQGVWGSITAFFHKYPPSLWIQKLGPLGLWIRTHVKQSIAIGAVLFVLLVILIIRLSVSDDPKPTNNTPAKVTQNKDTPNQNNPNRTPAVTPAESRKMHDEAYLMIVNATNEQEYRAGVALMTKSAEAGNDLAMWRLANLYGNPQNPTMYDRQKSVYWLRKSADAGNMDAKVTLRQMGG